MGGVPTHLDISLRVIAHPMRRCILVWLTAPQIQFPEQAYGENFGVCMSQIVRRSQLAPSTISNHLALLEKAGLIDRLKIGAHHFFKRNESSIASLKTSLEGELGNAGLKPAD